MRKLFIIAGLAVTTWGATSKKLVWSDEFGYTGLPDATKWAYDVGGNGWGNNELEYYTGSRAKNAWVDSGVLKITVRLEDTTSVSRGTSTTNHFTSARIVTRGKASWTYGRFEARMKMPKGLGMWPAFWMIPTTPNPYGYWPQSGEIDIFENWGYDAGTMRGSVQTSNHNGGTSVHSAMQAKAPADSFHVFALDWSKDTIAVSLDSMVYFKYGNPHTTSADWPFDQPLYIIINVAVSGTWGDTTQTQTSNLPQSLVVDWVRVWQDTVAGASIHSAADPKGWRTKALASDGTLFLVTDGPVRWTLLSPSGALIRTGSIGTAGTHTLGRIDTGVGYVSVVEDGVRRILRVAVP